MYRSDSDESLRQYRLSHHAPPPRPQSTLSLNQLCSRRSSNPDFYPGARRFSTSYSREDILSNDQLDQIHFDPRYRDYRSASSLNYSYNRSRSNSLNSVGSGGHQYQQFRRLSSHSPPLCAPLIQQKRWDTNPSIFIEEYHDDESAVKSKSESRSIKSERNSKETLCSSNESLQPLSECDIKSFGDLSKIPFIDDDSNDSAPCRFTDDERKSCLPLSQRVNSCRKTVSFDVIAGGPSTGSAHLFTSNGKNFPKYPNSIPNPTDNNPLLCRTNVRSSRDGINRNTQQSHHTSVPRSSSYDDHCTLVDKLIRLRLEEKPPLIGCKVAKPRGCEGKVKALTTYFNTLPYMVDECNCKKFHQSTPDLRDKLTFEEMEAVQRQLKEYSEFGLDKPTTCSFRPSPVTCRENEKFSRQYRDVLEKVEKRKNFHQSMSDIHCCKSSPQQHRCQEKVFHFRPLSEKHKCRSSCFNIKDPEKQRKKKEAKAAKSSLTDDDNESFVI